MSPDIIIRNARKEDAQYIAEGIMTALGQEMVDNMANGHGRSSVKQLFTRLAEMTDSQYSFTNTLIAESKDGEVAGVVVAYDGEILLRARRLFFDLTMDYFGWDIHEMVADGEPEVETDPSEYYLDSLAVFPAFRGMGIATSLINEVEKRARAVGKPVGLLCARDNDKARALYKHLGFKKVGERPFAGEMMEHMVRC